MNGLYLLEGVSGRTNCLERMLQEEATLSSSANQLTEFLARWVTDIFVHGSRTVKDNIARRLQRHGWAVDRVTEVCPHCHGKGRFSGTNYAYSCPECKGKGNRVQYTLSSNVQIVPTTITFN